ncbi:unnamed protein product [Phaedon cochleariae]|uniref:Uncharacterized protein n=1 Tax=Phaedon cochleariae TaxID=80249 RepID=A0A9P0DV51_PHACE|nr:unnamed protein product [Phaedon cochleariae]
MEEIEDDETFYSEGDTGIDPEKRKRRSSILKQKLGNQSDYFPDNVSCKASRRVSFASSNFVKPFAADPEKNTIWDNTYEEEVNHTDSTKSSEETQGSHASRQMNMSSFQIWESKSVQYVIPASVDQSDKENFVPIIPATCINDTNLNQTEMEFTGNYGNCYPDPTKISLVDYVRNKQASTDPTKMNLVEHVRNEQAARRSCDVSMFDMSFTCDFPRIQQGMNETVVEDMDISLPNDQEVEMELTTISNTNLIVNNRLRDINITNNSTSLKCKLNETKVESIDMEFTSNLTSIVKSLHTLVQKDDDSSVGMEFTTLQADDNCSENIDMELTRNSTTSQENKVSDFNIMQVVEVQDNKGELMFSEQALDKAIDETEKCSNPKQKSILKNTSIKSSLNKEMMISNEVQVSIDKNEKSCTSLKVGELPSNSKEGIDYENNQQKPISVHISKIFENNSEVFTDKNKLQKLSVDENKPLTETSPVQCKIAVEEALRDEDQAGKPTNILYSQPIKSILKRNDLSCNVVTPTMSFIMSLSSMSPCAETTQQLIQAKFSNPEFPESINILLKGKNAAAKINGDSTANESESNEMLSKPIRPLEDSKRELPVDPHNIETSWNMIQRDNTHPMIIDDKTAEEINPLEKHFQTIHEITPPIIIDENISLVENTPEQITPLKNHDTMNVSIVEKTPEEINSSLGILDSSNNYSNYTLRSKKVVKNIDKYLTTIHIDYDDSESERMCDMLCNEYAANIVALEGCLGNFRFPVFEVADFEELRREVSEEWSSSQSSDGALYDGEQCQKRLSMPDVVAPMSLDERVCDAAQRSEKYWQFVKSDGNYYCFFGCFRAVPFKVHTHPDLGKVYGVQTYNNLLDESIGLTHYEAKVFQLKLRQEHLLPHLGTNFDLLTLLDYVCLCTEEIEKFHLEFWDLVRKYGHSHKLTMHPDNSVTFEILHVDFIIWWKISVKMSTLNLGHADSVTATHELQEKVDEGHIKSIAENCVTGLTFLRCFIEKVDEYVQRIGKKIMMKREARLKYREF